LIGQLDELGHLECPRSSLDIFKELAARSCSLRKFLLRFRKRCAFLAGSKNAQKDHGPKDDPQGPLRRSGLTALLHSTEISQTRLAQSRSVCAPLASLRHEKFQSFRFGKRPGGHFFKAEKACIQAPPSPPRSWRPGEAPEATAQRCGAPCSSRALPPRAAGRGPARLSRGTRATS